MCINTHTHTHTLHLYIHRRALRMLSYKQTHAHTHTHTHPITHTRPHSTCIYTGANYACSYTSRRRAARAGASKFPQKSARYFTYHQKWPHPHFWEILIVSARAGASQISQKPIFTIEQDYRADVWEIVLVPAVDELQKLGQAIFRKSHLYCHFSWCMQLQANFPEF